MANIFNAAKYLIEMDKTLRVSLKDDSHELSDVVAFGLDGMFETMKEVYAFLLQHLIPVVMIPIGKN